MLSMEHRSVFRGGGGLDTDGPDGATDITCKSIFTLFVDQYRSHLTFGDNHLRRTFIDRFSKSLTTAVTIVALNRFIKLLPGPRITEQSLWEM